MLYTLILSHAVTLSHTYICILTSLV